PRLDDDVGQLDVVALADGVEQMLAPRALLGEADVAAAALLPRPLELFARLVERVLHAIDLAPQPLLGRAAFLEARRSLALLGHAPLDRGRERHPLRGAVRRARCRIARLDAQSAE